MNPAEILDDCLQRLQAGEALASCLARYPDQTAGLRPMLAAAEQMQGLAGYRLSNGQRLRATVTLRETLAQRTVPRPWFAWLTDAGQQHGFAMAAVLVVILFLSWAVNSVAASLPGQPAYPLRVAVERAPVILQTTPKGRAAVELNVAERRLEDLHHHPASAGQPNGAALAALLRSDEAAAAQVHNLAEAAQWEPVASRIAAHAEQLTQLAAAAATQSAADALTAAAERTYAIAERLRRGLPPGEPGDRPTPQRGEGQPTRPAPTPTATPTATASALPVAPPPADDPPQPTETPEPRRTQAPGWRATAISETATAHPTLPRPPEPPPDPRPGGTHTPGALPPLPPAIATRLPRTPEPTRTNRPALPPPLPPVAPTPTPEVNAGAGSTATPAPASSPEPAPGGRRLPRLRP